MERYPRLTRSQVIAKLREHAAKHGFVSNETLNAHDKVLKRSLPLHFVGVAAAREAAGVSGPPYKKPRKKTGPKPTSKIGRRPPIWSRERVLEELRELHREGKRTAHADLMQAGLVALIHAAYTYVGGLRRARELAGIPAPPPRRTKKNTYNKEAVIDAIRARRRKKQTLSSSLVPPRLFTAGRWHFGNWSAALAAAGIDPAEVRRPPAHKYTKQEIISRLRRAAQSGSDLRSISLAKIVKMESVRREFGSLHTALVAAGLGDRLKERKHGLQKWNRERVIEVLRERAAQDIYTLTPGLHRVVQLHFGGAEHARAAAGVPSPVDMRGRALQRHEARKRRERMAKARAVAASMKTSGRAPQARRGGHGS